MASSPGTSRRKRLTAPERYQQLLVAAREAYLELGVDRASVHQVAKFAGVNVATIYQHFASSSDLFHEAVLVELTSRVDAHLARADTRLEQASLDQRGAALHACLLDLMIDVGPTMNALLFSENDAGRHHLRVEIRPRIHAWLSRALHGADYPEAAVRPSTSSVLLGTYLWLSVHASFRREDATAAGWAERIADFVDGGIVLAEGRGTC